MIDGNWTEAIVIDASLAPAVRDAIERILTGAAGGPWAKLASFVSRRLETRYLPIVLDEDGPSKRVRVDGLFEGEITEIRGRNRSQPVTFRNMFNQVHAPDQVIARGATRYDDGVIVVSHQGTHGLHSQFDWIVGGGSS
jgi:hypothetical protein